MSKARGPYRVDPLGYKKANEALDKMAENARELGLDYEFQDKDPDLIEQPAQQEPVAMHEDWYDSNSCGHCGMVGGHTKTCRHYTSPPAQRKPLDAGEISRLWKQHTSEDGPHHNPYDDDGLGFARAIEAKLKEKNQ